MRSDPNRRIRTLFCVGLMLLAGLTSACHGSGSSRSPGSTSGSQSGGPGTTKALTVVSDLPRQGPSGLQAKTLNDAESLFLAQQGGMAGTYRVRLETHDDSTAASAGWNQAKCKSNATSYVADKTVVGILGTFNSGCTKIELPIANRGDLTMISPTNTDVGLTQSGPGAAAGEPGVYYPDGTRNYARVVVPDDVQGAAAAQLMQKLGVKSVYILNDREPYGVGIAEATAVAAGALGITVLGDEGIDQRQSGFTALFTRIKGLNPDAIFLATSYGGGAVRLVRDKVAVLGPNSGVRLIAPDRMNVDDLPSASGAGTAAEGMYLTAPGLDSAQLKARGGAAAAFLTAYEASYGQPGPSTVYGAACMQAILKAIAASDGTRGGVTAQLSQLKVSSGDSVLGQGFSFDENGDITLTDVSVYRVTGQNIPVDQVLSADPSLLEP